MLHTGHRQLPASVKSPPQPFGSVIHLINAETPFTLRGARRPKRRMEAAILALYYCGPVRNIHSSTKVPALTRVYRLLTSVGPCLTRLIVIVTDAEV